MPSYPEYSADFFDGEHFVMKGASPATARELLRPTFRNWFRARYPYVYATFRCARDSQPGGVHVSIVNTRVSVRRARRRNVHGAIRRRRAVLPEPGAAPAAVALSVRCARLGVVRRDLPAAVVRADAGRDPTARAHAAEIFAALAPLSRIVELGSGSGEKLVTLLHGRAPQSVAG